MFGMSLDPSCRRVLIQNHRFRIRGVCGPEPAGPEPEPGIGGVKRRLCGPESGRMAPIFRCFLNLPAHLCVTELASS